MMKKYFLLLFALLIFGINCKSKEKVIEATGIVLYVELEDGFYGIETDAGEHYYPINLSSGFEINGLPIEFKGKTSDKLVDFYDWGETIELIDIKKL